MADSVKEKILKNLKTTLEGVTTGAGYHVTLNNIGRYLSYINPKVTLPRVEIISGREKREHGMSQIVHSDFEVRVVLYAAQQDGDTTPMDQFLDPYFQDISKVLRLDNTRGGYAFDTEIAEVEPFELEDGQIMIGLIFDLLIKFRTDPDDVTVDR